MAKTKGPLLSLEAHGSLSKILTYSKKRTGSQVRKYNKPLVTPSAAQRGQRRLTEFLVAQWQNMSDADKATWAANARASSLNLSGYHYFLRTAQRDLYTHHGLCGYWHCNEIIGGKVLDLSGNRNHGTLQPSYPSNVPQLVTSKELRFGRGLLYDGVDEFVSLGNNPILNPTTRITIEVLIKPTIVDNSTRVFFTLGWNVTAKKGVKLALHTDNKLKLDIGTGSAISTISANSVTHASNWYTTVITWDGTTIKLHINNITQTDTTPFAGPISYHPVDDFIGGFPPVFFGGIVDEACVYNRAFSAAEIATRYKFATAKV